MSKCNAFAATKSLNGIEFELFTQDELKAIHEATIDVLSEPGIQVSDANARAVFKENGCLVDEKTKIVKIPEFIVRRALQTAPSRFTLWARNKKYNTVMECGGKVHWTCFGTGVKMCNYLGPGKYETVDSVEQDIADIAKLCDWAENIDYYSLPVSARDWAGKGAQDVHEVFTPLTSTEKHYHDIDPVGENVETYWEVIKAYYGGNEEEALKKPIMSLLVCPTSPLELSSNACQVIMKGARNNMPVNVLSMAMSGGSSPVYLAGTLVTHNAEVLSGIVLAQITNPGTPVFYGSSTTTFDLKMGTAPVGSPELGLISAGVSKLAKFYGLPAFVAGAQTDAKVPDAQAGHEKTITTALAALAGSNTIYGSGMLELGMTFSMEQLVIDNDIIAMVKKAMEGIPVSEETLGVDQIKKVGIGNNFLALKKTRELVDLPSSPKLFDRKMFGDWYAAGAKDAADRAHETVVDVMKNHEVPAVDKDIYAAMKAIVDKADKEYKI